MIEEKYLEHFNVNNRNSVIKIDGILYEIKHTDKYKCKGCSLKKSCSIDTYQRCVDVSSQPHILKRVPEFEFYEDKNPDLMFNQDVRIPNLFLRPIGKLGRRMKGVSISIDESVLNSLRNPSNMLQEIKTIEISDGEHPCRIIGMDDDCTILVWHKPAAFEMKTPTIRESEKQFDHIVGFIYISDDTIGRDKAFEKMKDEITFLKSIG